MARRGLAGPGKAWLSLYGMDRLMIFAEGMLDSVNNWDLIIMVAMVCATYLFSRKGAK